MEHLTLDKIATAISIVAMALSAFNFIRSWLKERPILHFYLTKAEAKVMKWQEHELRAEIDRLKERGKLDPAARAMAEKAENHIGKIKKYFLILEFILKNEGKKQALVSRIIVNGWVDRDRHYEFPDPWSDRDYRVYDLFTKEPISLSTPVLVGPEQSIGRRIEIYESALKPAYMLTRYSTAVSYEPLTILIETEKGNIIQVVKPKEDEFFVERPSAWGPAPAFRVLKKEVDYLTAEITE